MDPPRSESVLQVRRSKFLQRVSNWRIRLRKDEKEHPYMRQSRSMDVAKPFMSQPILHHDADQASLLSDSPDRLEELTKKRHPRTSLDGLPSVAAYTPPKSLPGLPSEPALPHSQTLPDMPRQILAPFSGNTQGVNGAIANTTSDKSNQMHMRSATLPPSSSVTPRTPSSSPRRPPGPGILVLPGHRFSLTLTDQGSARLSPSIISRMPMPILNLPTLPPGTDVNETASGMAVRKRVESRVKLRSMPALPLTGAHSDHDSDNEDDEDDDEEGMDDEEEVGSSEHHLASDGGDGDEEGLARPSFSSASSAGGERAESRASSYRSPFQAALPSVDTTRIDLSFLDNPPIPPPKDKGKGRATKSTARPSSPTTPTAGGGLRASVYYTPAGMSTYNATPTGKGKPKADYFSLDSSQSSPAPSDHSDGPLSPSSSAVRIPAESSFIRRRKDPSPPPGSPLRTPRPGDTYPMFFPLAETAEKSMRPGLYTQASRSMIDISRMAEPQIQLQPTAKGKRKSLYPEGLQEQLHLREAGNTIKEHDEGAVKAAKDTKKPDAPLATSASLRRRRSLPTFTAGSPPPPYPSFAPHYPHPLSQYHPSQQWYNNNTMNPDQDADEPLPSYSNSIYLRSTMPRKMEFTKPGVQARDRKWRRVICELEGTVLRVYQCPKRSVLGSWWESKVGVGDVSIGAAATPAKIAGPNSSTRTAPNAGVGKLGDSAGAQTTLQVPSSSTLHVPSSSSAPSSSSSRMSMSSSGARSPSSPSPPPSGDSETHSIQPSRSRLGNLFKATRPHARSKSDVPNPPVVARTSRSSFNLPRPSFSSDARGGSPAASSITSESSPSNLSLSVSIPGGSDSSFSPHDISSSATSPGSPLITTETRSSSSLAPPSASGPRSASSTRTGSSRIASGSSASAHSHNQSHSGHGHAGKGDEEDLEKGELIKAYTMQHAESGLGNDYLKRKNVIRVRMEGEQFLLQAKDVAGVVEWIEALHCATNIALDLDERVMPRGPLFPRRRRRRGARRTGTETQGGTTTTTLATPQAPNTR